VKDSKAVANKWRAKANWTETLHVQELCAEAIEKLGYVKFSNEEELSNTEKFKSFSVF